MIRWLRSRWLTLLALVLVFLAGVVLGSAVTARAIQRRFEERINPANWEPRTLAWLDRTFGLTAEQREAVAPIVRESVEELGIFRDRTEVERRGILTRMMVRLAFHLDERQREKLREMSRHARKDAPGDLAGVLLH